MPRCTARGLSSGTACGDAVFMCVISAVCCMCRMGVSPFGTGACIGQLLTILSTAITEHGSKMAIATHSQPVRWTSEKASSRQTLAKSSRSQVHSRTQPHITGSKSVRVPTVSKSAPSISARAPHQSCSWPGGAAFRLLLMLIGSPVRKGCSRHESAVGRRRQLGFSIACQTMRNIRTESEGCSQPQMFAGQC